MKIGLYCRVFKEKDTTLIQQLVDVLLEKKVAVHIYEPYYQQIVERVHFKQEPIIFNDHDNLNGRIDFLLSIGGDGTLLNTITIIKEANIPVMGINTGRLGFLTGVNRNEIVAAIDELLNNSFLVDNRSLIHLDCNKPLFNNHPYALNEFTIHKSDTSSMITVHAYVNGIFLNTYWADGIIVATPTGSTAYSLSCGGPIMHPSSQTFVITPVAPHNLNVRPIVIPNDKVISFEIAGRGESFLCTLDSRYETIDKTYSISVKKESFGLQLVRLQASNFFSTIRNKLMWGLDKRDGM